MTKNVPSKQSKTVHGNYVMTERQAKRMLKAKNGRAESKPGDYDINKDEELIRLRDARLKLEDMRIARELGIDPE